MMAMETVDQIVASENQGWYTENEVAAAATKYGIPPERVLETCEKYFETAARTYRVDFRKSEGAAVAPQLTIDRAMRWGWRDPGFAAQVMAQEKRHALRMCWEEAAAWPEAGWQFNAELTRLEAPLGPSAMMVVDAEGRRLIYR